MQDDVTDATLWAIAEGITERDSVCIFGTMGAVKDDLYACAIVYVGVYDLEMMLEEGDIPFTQALDQALGDDRVDLYQSRPWRSQHECTAR